MQNTASLPSDQFDSLLHQLPGTVDLDQIARQTKAIERQREIGSGADLPCALPWRAVPVTCR